MNNPTPTAPALRDHAYQPLPGHWTYHRCTRCGEVVRYVPHSPGPVLVYRPAPSCVSERAVVRCPACGRACSVMPDVPAKCRCGKAVANV